MLLDREELLTTLKVASAGAALPPRMVTLEQSDCFIFHEGSLVTFNDEILTRSKSPLDFDAVCAAADLLKVLGKLPDRKVKVYPKKGELIVQGKKRSAGITMQAEVLLPFGDVPRPGKWHPIRQGVPGLLKQAARTCGKDLSDPLTTVVHATGDVVEATDNFRIFRAQAKTGFPKEVLIPAFSLGALEAIPLRRISIYKGWVHFRTSKIKGEGTEISVRCIKDDYLDISPALKLKSPEVVHLPGNLADIIERTEVMIEGAEPLVLLSISDGLLTIKAQKDNGWYREQKKIAYEGTPLKFHVNPKSLCEVLQRTTVVRIGQGRMKLSADGIQFLITLEAK